MSDTTERLKVRHSVARLALGVSNNQLRSLKLRHWKEGNASFFDPDQINALLALREHWRKTSASR